MPKRDFNVKNKLREEESSIDDDLKAAGLWEEGLSLLQKRRLVKFIADSKSSAQEEEEYRKKFYPPVEPTSSDQDITEVYAQDDFDPVITYESPSSHQNRKQVTSKEINSSKNSNSSNYSSFKEIAQSSTHSENKNVSSSSNTETLKCIKSLLSNSSIKINSQSVNPVTSSDKENLIVSESEDETNDPQIIDNNGEKSINDCDDIEEVFRKSDKDNMTGKIFPDKKKSMPNGDSSSFQGNAVPNKSDTKTQMKTVDKCIPSSIKMVQSQNLEQQLNYISLESPTKTQENNIKVDKQNESKVIDECISEDMVLTTKKGCYSDISDARWKRRLVSEKPNQAYFRSPYETDTKCVKRICSLITEWQSILAKHQRSLSHPCKWGPPICVDRKVEGLIKNLNRRPVRNPAAEVIYDSDVTESDFHISDQSSEEEWEIFSHKKKKAKAKNHNVWHRKIMKYTTTNTVKDIEMNYGKSTKSLAEKQIIEPAVATSSNNLGVEEQIDSQKESLSSEGLWIDSLKKSKNINPHKFYKKSGRKTFQLTPDENQESIEIDESNSSELPDLNSKNSASEEVSSEQCVSNHQGNSLNFGSFTRNSTGPSNVTYDDKRVSIKRKGDSDSHELPPYKKSASEISKDFSQPNISEDYDSQSITPSVESQESSLQNDNKVQEPSNREADAVVQGSINSIEEKMDTDSKEDNSIECPLCQVHFPVEEIEAHASECNGPVEQTQHQQQQQEPSTSTGETSSRSYGQSYKSLSQQTSDVLYLGTRSQSSRPRN